MQAQAVTNLVTMGYSPFDIGYDAFYKRHSYFEDNASVGCATTNGLQDIFAQVTPVEHLRVMDIAFLVSSNTGCCAEISRCETPPAHAQSAYCGLPDPLTSTDTSTLTSANLRGNGTRNVTGALEAQNTIGKNDTKRYKPSSSKNSSEYLHGVLVRIKTTNNLWGDVPRSLTRQAPKKLLLSPCHNNARSKIEKLNEVLEKIEKVLSPGETVYASPVCPSELTTKTSFQEHLKLNLGERTFECHLSLRRFVSQQSPQNHIIRPSKVSLECHICHKVLFSVVGHRMHMESHSGITYECTICKKVLQSKISFDGHMKKHTENRVYECPFCLKKLSCQLTLKAHIRLHTGEKPYECKFCHIKTTTSQILRNHMKKHM